MKIPPPRNEKLVAPLIALIECTLRGGAMRFFMTRGLARGLVVSASASVLVGRDLGSSLGRVLPRPCKLAL